MEEHESANLEDQLNGIKAYLCGILNQTVGPKSELVYIGSYNVLANAIRDVVSGKDLAIHGVIADEARRRIAAGSMPESDKYFFGIELKPE